MDGTVPRETWTRRDWIWLIAAGFSVSVLGVIVGLQKAGPLCGSPLVQESRPAKPAGVRKDRYTDRGVSSEMVRIPPTVATAIQAATEATNFAKSICIQQA